MAEEKKYTHEIRVALSEVVEKLPVNEHPNIYRIVKPRDPAALEDCEDDANWAYVYFHLLRPSTLRELENYLASRNVNTQTEIRANNPDLESKEGNVKSTEQTAKLRSSKGSKGGTSEPKNENIKARLRKPSRKSDAGSSKQM